MLCPFDRLGGLVLQILLENYQINLSKLPPEILGGPHPASGRVYSGRINYCLGIFIKYDFLKSSKFVLAPLTRKR